MVLVDGNAPPIVFRGRLRLPCGRRIERRCSSGDALSGKHLDLRAARR
jgi:hypothetical protein